MCQRPHDRRPTSVNVRMTQNLSSGATAGGRGGGGGRGGPGGFGGRGGPIGGGRGTNVSINGTGAVAPEHDRGAQRLSRPWRRDDEHEHQRADHAQRAARPLDSEHQRQRRAHVGHHHQRIRRHTKRRRRRGHSLSERGVNRPGELGRADVDASPDSPASGAPPPASGATPG